MSHDSFMTNRPITFGLRYMQYEATPESKRMETRMAELDAAHGKETRRLRAIVRAARKALFTKATRQER